MGSSPIFRIDEKKKPGSLTWAFSFDRAGSYWEDGHWIEIPAMSDKREYDFDKVGHKDMYLLHHEEIESLAVNIPKVKRIRFIMTFGQSCLTHMNCLQNVGMLSTTPIMYEGREIDNMSHAISQLPYALISEVLATMAFLIFGFIS